MTAEELARRMARDPLEQPVLFTADGERTIKRWELLLPYAQALLGMREALRMAHEWSAGFPLKGTASDFDHSTAFHVYTAAEAALKAADALLGPLDGERK